MLKVIRDHADSRAARAGGQLSKSPPRSTISPSKRARATREKISLIRDIVAKNVNVKKIINSL